MGGGAPDGGDLDTRIRLTRPFDAAQRVELRGRTVAGYFLDEVLYRQPADVVDFMLATSVLDELSPPRSLHGAVRPCRGLGASPSTPIRRTCSSCSSTRRRASFRYHHLISEVLRSELHARDPSRERLLNITAAEYLADVGEIGRAARHLLAAGEPTSALQPARRAGHTLTSRSTGGSVAHST